MVLLPSDGLFSGLDNPCQSYAVSDEKTAGTDRSTSAATDPIPPNLQLNLQPNLSPTLYFAPMGLLRSSIPASPPKKIQKS